MKPSAPRRRAAALSHAALAWAIGCAANPVAAAGKTPTDPRCAASAAGGSAGLCRNDFTLELYQGPVLAPTRVIGLGGAYAALAEGVDGLGQNAAASVVRPAFSSTYLDYDISLGVSFTGAFGRTDFDNSGQEGIRATTFFYTLGGMVQIGDFGVGVLADFQRYSVATDDLGDSAAVTVGRLHATAGYNFWDGQLGVAAGVRGVTAAVDAVTPGQGLTGTHNVLTTVGIAPEVGAIIKPDFLPWRLGATYRAPAGASTSASESTPDAYGVRRAAGLAVPHSVLLPWEIEVGVALSAGPRPLNPRWVNPHDHERQLRDKLAAVRAARARARDLELSHFTDPAEREARRRELEHDEALNVVDEEDRLGDALKHERQARYENWPRPRLTVVAELLVTGPTAGGIGLRSFLQQQDVPSGTRVTTEPRLGLEGEPILNRMATRVGTYLEPTRYVVPATEQGLVAGARQHFTVGLETRLFTLDVLGITGPTQWSITAIGDLAPRYQNVGLSIGTWH